MSDKHDILDLMTSKICYHSYLHKVKMKKFCLCFLTKGHKLIKSRFYTSDGMCSLTALKMKYTVRNTGILATM